MYFVGNDSKTYTCEKGKKSEWVNNKYLCIVDINSDTVSVWGINDTIAQRLLMLKEDTVLAKEIYDKGDKMDSHWIDILRGVEI